MKRMFLMMALLAGCGPKDVESYDNGLFELASGFSAKEVCSCVFVVGQDEDTCADWSRVSPDVAKFKVDRETKTVKAKALGMGKQVAKFEGEKTGCVLVRE